MTDEFRCVFCGETFDRSWDMRRHRMNHTPEERIMTCPECGFACRTPSAMRRHMEGIHDPRIAAERFWSKVDKDGPVPEIAPELGPCWMWKASFSTKGYGRFSYPGGKYCAAHKYAYELLVGPVPDGLELDHLCRNPACCRPDHLEAVPHAENMARAYAVREERACLICGFTSFNLPALLNHIRWKHPNDRVVSSVHNDATSEGQ